MKNSKLQDSGSSQQKLIEQMQEVILIQEQKIEVLRELNHRFEEENLLLKKHNSEILDTVHLMLDGR